MNSTKITDEQRRAIATGHGEPVPAQDDENQTVYYIYSEVRHRQATEALRQRDDMAAIQAGIDDMEAGRVTPVDEADSRLRKRLGFPPRQP